MGYNRRWSEAAQRAAERRQREDAAPRLLAEVPNLTSLALTIDERRPSGSLAGGSHIRRVMVQTAPALFNLPCSDRSCNDGGHDCTRAVMNALRASQTRFEHESTCHGHLGSTGAPCEAVLRYVGVATYDPPTT